MVCSLVININLPHPRKAVSVRVGIILVVFILYYILITSKNFPKYACRPCLSWQVVKVVIGWNVAQFETT